MSDQRVMRMNYWAANAPELAAAYIQSASNIRFELVTRTLLALMPLTPQRIIDVGGGYGMQALMLAQAGHQVTVVDLDATMLNYAQELSRKAHADIQQRLTFVLADGCALPAEINAEFDLVCCHSVLMYEPDPQPLLTSLLKLAKPSGLLSIVSVNPMANAMRSALQGKWRQAVATLQCAKQMDEQFAPCKEHSLEQVTAIVELLGGTVIDWHGLGIFTDHHTTPIVAEDPKDVILAEWLAGTRDPYRQIARCYHLIVQNAPA